MLAVDTTDDWGFAVDVTVGGTATYTNDGDANGNAYAAIVAFVAWANDPARAWHAFTTFAWSWARDTATGGAKLTLTAAGFPFDLNNGAHARLGLAADNGANEIIGDQPASGTWAPPTRIAVARHVRQLADGDAGGSRLVRHGAQGLACYSPTVSAVGTALDAARLAAVLAVATTPRRAYVYQVHRAAWRHYALGPVSRSPEGATAYRFTLECAGDAL